MRIQQRRFARVPNRRTYIFITGQSYAIVTWEVPVPSDNSNMSLSLKGLRALSFHQKLRSLILCDLHFFPLEIPSISSDEEQGGLKPVTLYSSIAAGSVLFIISLIIIAIFYVKKHRR